MQPLNSGKLPPITHRQLLDFMQALGYHLEIRGMCNGFTHVAIMAALLGQFDVYTRRLRLLRKIYHENLDLILNKNMSAEEKRQRLEEYLETVYVAKNEGPKEKHSTKTDILAFFDAVVVYQGSYLNRHLFPRGRNLPIQSFKDSFLLVSPTVFDGKRKAGIEGRDGKKDGEEDDFALGPIMVKPFGSGVYQREHLERYFGELEKKIPRLNLKGPVCLRLRNDNHTFVVSYSSRKKKWTLIDSGEPTYYTDRELTRLSRAVLAKFEKQRHESVAITTILYTHFDDAKYIKELSSGYKKKPGMHAKPIQELTTDEQFELLYVAVNADNSFLIKMILLQGKVNINQASKTGLTLLMLACVQVHINAVKLLLKAQADINYTNIHGFSALFIACQNGREAVVKFLLANNANHTLSGKASIQVLRSLAKKQGREKQFQDLLQQHNISINDKTIPGFSPLAIAVFMGHEAIVKMLLEKTQSAELNKGPIRLIELARAMGHASIARLLMAKTKPEPNKVSHQALVSPGNGSAFYHDVRRLLDALYAELKEGHLKSNISENGKVGGCLDDLLTLNWLLQRAQGQENKNLPSYRSTESERIKKAFETVCNMTITNTTQMVDILRVFRALPYAKQGALDRTVRSRGVRLAPS